MCLIDSLQESGRATLGFAQFLGLAALGKLLSSPHRRCTRHIVCGDGRAEQLHSLNSYLAASALRSTAKPRGRSFSPSNTENVY